MLPSCCNAMRRGFGAVRYQSPIYSPGILGASSSLLNLSEKMNFSVATNSIPSVAELSIRRLDAVSLHARTSNILQEPNAHHLFVYSDPAEWHKKRASQSQSSLRNPV